MNKDVVWLLGAAILVVIVLIAVTVPNLYLRKSGNMEPPDAHPSYAEPLPTNGFRVSQQERLAPSSAVPRPLREGMGVNSPFSVSRAASTSILDIIAGAVSSTVRAVTQAPRTTPPANIFPLPVVPDSELTITAGGAKNFKQFAHVILDARVKAEVKFDRKRFDVVLKDANKVPYSLTDLMEMARTPEGWNTAQSSLVVLRDFIGARVVYLKTVGVSGSAIEFNRTIIAFDKLTMQVLDKVIQNQGSPSDNLAKELKEYAATGEYYNQVVGTLIRKEGGVVLSSPTFMDRVATLLSSFIPRVYAQAGGSSEEPFGGPITYYMDCSACNMGFMIRVTNAVDDSSLSLFISWITYSTLLYINKAPYSGHNIVGLYTEDSGQCEQPVCDGDCCEIDSYDGTLYMAGTS